MDFPLDTELYVERAYRTLVSKPGVNTRLRLIVVKFLRYKVKEGILEAWKKKDIFVGNKKSISIMIIFLWFFSILGYEKVLKEKKI